MAGLIGVTAAGNALGTALLAIVSIAVLQGASALLGQKAPGAAPVALSSPWVPR
jgi:hypothetical protein